MKLKERMKKFLFNIKKGIERFPLTIFFSIAAFILSVYIIQEISFLNMNSMTWMEEIFILSILGIFISASLELIREKYFSDRNKLLMRGAEGVISLILLYFIKIIYMSSDIYGHTFELKHTLELNFIWITSFLIFLLIPVIGRKDGEKYIQTVTMNIFTTIAFSIILYLGIIAIIAAVDILLTDVDNNMYAHMFFFTTFIFGVTFFLSRLKGINENLEEYEMNPVLNILLKFIIIPLILGYTAVLYFYLGKIIIRMKVPKGIVSHLVLWYTVFSLFIIIIITPAAQKDKIVNMFKKNFPKISIPLIILSIVAISQRIGQYGITKNRYLIFITGLWLLFCMTFYIFRTRLTVIIISIIAVIFIGVYSPFNAWNVSIISQRNRLERILIKNGILINGKLEKNSNLNVETKAEIADILDYITENGGISNLKSYVKSDVKHYEIEEEFRNAIGMDNSWYSYYHNNSEKGGLNITYKTMEKDKGYYQNILKTYGYDYMIFFDNMDKSSENQETSTEDYFFEFKNENITISDKNRKELIKIELKKILNEIAERKEMEVKSNQEAGNLEMEVPEKVMEYIGENENIKYKLKVKSMDVNKSKEKNISIEFFNCNLYFSVK